MTADDDRSEHDETPGEVHEPDNSTVDDWFGQNVARDQEVADRVASESSSEEEAQQRFDAEAHGEERFREGHHRPDDADITTGDEVGRPADEG